MKPKAQLIEQRQQERHPAEAQPRDEAAAGGDAERCGSLEQAERAAALREFECGFGVDAVATPISAMEITSRPSISDVLKVCSPKTLQGRRTGEPMPEPRLQDQPDHVQRVFAFFAEIRQVQVDHHQARRGRWEG